MSVLPVGEGERDFLFDRLVPSGIIIPKGRRDLVEANVVAIMESVKLVGLRVPINVWRTHPGTAPILVSGAHRLEACKRLGWSAVPAYVIKADNEVTAQIAEIDENLRRANLSPSQEAVAIERRRELEASLADGEISGANAPDKPKSEPGKRNRDRAAASDRDIAAKTGRSKDGVRRARKRVEKIGVPTLERIGKADPDGKKGLNKAGALDRLAAMPEADRLAAIARAEVGEIVEEVKPDDIEAEIRAILRPWNRASVEAQRGFLQRIGGRAA